MSTDEPLELVRSICDRFVRWQGPSGRPDPAHAPFVTTEYGFTPTNGHCPPMMARALYMFFDRTGESRYKEAADRYAIFSFSYPRDPVDPARDRQRNQYLDRMLLAGRERDARSANHFLSRSWIYGMALNPALYEFKRHNPNEDCYDARGDALFDWLQRHRTDLGHAYNVGYAPLNCSTLAVTDAAYTDDLRLVGRGLVGYYLMTGRQEALDSATRLADYFLRPHRPGFAEGAFLEELGTWCIGPWPIAIACEHFEDIRMDRAGWGWTARGAVEFLTLLHACLPPDHPRASLMRDRCTRSLRWQFTCQFDNGAVGMHGQDDHWLGMTAGALLAYADLYKTGWIDASLARELAPRVEGARQWLIENTTEAMLNEGGYRRVTGRTTPWPPENLVWLLTWTVEALLRLDEVVTAGEQLL